MKKILQYILVLAGLTSCSGQELDGVWMSYKNRIIDSTKSSSGLGMVGLILDFQNLELGHYLKDTVIEIKPNFRKNTIKTELTKHKLKFYTFGRDSLEIRFNEEANIASVFRPLDLSHKLNLSESELADYLINSKFKLPALMEFKFTNEPDYFEKIASKPRTKKRLLESSSDHPSYWFLKEIKENYFLILGLDINSENIYQIISISDNGLILKPLQEDYPISNNMGLKTGLLELQTCL